MSGFVAPALNLLLKDCLSVMKFTSHWHLWKFAGLVAADTALFSFTNAANVPSYELIVGFLLLAVTFYYLVCSLLTFIKLYGVSVRRKRHLAAAATGLASGLVALQSIGELNSRDVAVLLPLMVVGYVYSFYGKSGVKAMETTMNGP